MISARSVFIAWRLEGLQVIGTSEDQQLCAIVVGQQRVFVGKRRPDGQSSASRAEVP